LGILAEAAHSALDFLAAGVTFFAVKFADKPADKEHLYGHGKAENFAALVETLLLLATCIWIINEAVERLITQRLEIEVSVWAYLVMGISIVIDYSRSRALYRVAKKYNNQALEADALHFSTDIWSSAVVILGLVFASFHVFAADAIAAISVAIIVMFVSYKLGKRTIDALMDKIPEGVYDNVLSAVRGVEGVEDILSLRMRQGGPKIFLDMTVAVRRTLPFEIAHRIISDIEQRILGVLPNADSVIHAEPVESHAETLEEQIRMTVASEGMFPHHIRVYQAGEERIVDLHIEYPRTFNFVEAHTISEALEKKIRERFSGIKDVRIHIEELVAPRTTVNITARSEEIIETIRAIAHSEQEVTKCDDIVVYQLENGKLKIALNCAVTAHQSLEIVHAIVSRIENKIYQQVSNVETVLVHAEPFTEVRVE